MSVLSSITKFDTHLLADGYRHAWYDLTDHLTVAHKGERQQRILSYEALPSIPEGALAKLFKTIDDPRSRSSFALYKSYQKTLLSPAPSDSLNK